MSPAKRRGYRLTAGVLLVMMLGGTLPVPLYVLYEKQMGFGPLGVTVVFAAYVVGLISLQVGPVDASAYVSGLAAAIVAVAFVMVLHTFGTAPAPEPPCTPSDGWCGPEELAGSGAGTRSAVGGPSHLMPP